MAISPPPDKTSTHTLEPQALEIRLPQHPILHPPSPIHTARPPIPSLQSRSPISMPSPCLLHARSWPPEPPTQTHSTSQRHRWGLIHVELATRDLTALRDMFADMDPRIHCLSVRCPPRSLKSQPAPNHAQPSDTHRNHAHHRYTRPPWPSTLDPIEHLIHHITQPRIAVQTYPLPGSHTAYILRPTRVSSLLQRTLRSTTMSSHSLPTSMPSACRCILLPPPLPPNRTWHLAHGTWHAARRTPVL